MKKPLRCRIGIHAWEDCVAQNVFNVLGRYCSRCGVVQDLMLAAGGFVTVGQIDPESLPNEIDTGVSDG